MKIIILALFSLKTMSIELGKPQMLVQMLKFKQQRLSQVKCHEPSTILEKEIRNRESFDATVECEIKCRDEQKQRITVEKEFKAKDYSLSPGDGSAPNFTVWRSLGITLNIFKKQVCLDKAKAKCKEIESFNVTSISSGDWSLSEDITCKTKSIIKSPFDPGHKLKQKEAVKTSATNIIPNLWQLNSRPLELSQNSELDTNHAQVLDINNCKNKVKVSSCFGDCIFEDISKKHDFVETLSTSNPLGEDYYELCIDKEFEKMKHSSKSVSKFRCEKFVWDTVTRLRLSGESCAALRYNTNCVELF